MRIIDAHAHISLRVEKPLQDLLSEMDANNVERSMLILNMPNERAAFLKEYNLYCANKDRFGLCCGLDFHNNESKRDLEKMLERTGEKVVIKIHPKLFGIVKEDIQYVLDSVKEYSGLPIIVDALYYAEDIEHHIGVDVSVALAREYNDRKIIVAHSGSLDFLKCMMACRYMPHVFFDFSFIQSFFNHTSLRLDMVNFLSRTSNRIMFGSDRPSFNLGNAIADFLDIVKESGITSNQMEDVLYKNALGLYWN